MHGEGRILAEIVVGLDMRHFSCGDSRFVFDGDPNQFAVGNNMVGLRLTQRPRNARKEIRVEMLEQLKSPLCRPRAHEVGVKF